MNNSGAVSASKGIRVHASRDHDTVDGELFTNSYQKLEQQWEQYAIGIQDHYPSSSTGPDGQSLGTRTAWIGHPEADQVLVILSGVHGIETPVGHALQLDLMKQVQMKETSKSSWAILVVHALSPWGMAWHRRCDENGVDLNRNGLDFSKELPKNLDYSSLKDIFLIEDSKSRHHILAKLKQSMHDEAFDRAVSGGQYVDPSGPFYGGREPSHGHLTSLKIIEKYQLSKRKVCVLDIHSGLGDYGHGELICDLDEQGLQRAEAIFGVAVTCPRKGPSCSVPKFGLVDDLWHRNLGPDSTFLTLEFGTHGTDALFQVLFDDHAMWSHRRHLNDTLRQQQAERMIKHFNPRDTTWQKRVLHQGRLAIQQVLTSSAWIA